MITKKKKTLKTSKLWVFEKEIFDQINNGISTKQIAENLPIPVTKNAVIGFWNRNKNYLIKKYGNGSRI